MESKMKQFLIVCFCLMAFSACKETSPVISLAGEWQFAMDSTDVGVLEKWFDRSFDDKIQLPGTTDEAGYGVPNALLPSIGKPQILHLTRKNSYVGPAWYSREVTIPSDWKDKSIELKLERVIWQTRVWVDGNPVSGSCESLISPHVFDLTEYLTPGKHKLTVRIDNRKQHDISVNDMAHAYTNETQIMWNGIIGEISLRAKEALSIEDLQVYPDISGKQVHVKGKICNRGGATEGILQAVVQKQKNSPITTVTRDMEFPSGETLLDITCPMGDSMEVWNEFTPTLYQLDLKVEADSEKAGRSTKFGMREFSHNRSDLLLNGNKAFLRGTLECCIFPLTGRPPMEPEGWKKVFLNHFNHCVRFDVDGLGIVFKPDFVTGEKLFPCKNAMLCKQRNVLLSNEMRKCIRSCFQIVETTFFCFFNPFICITVSVEDNSFVINDRLFQQIMNSGIHIFSRNIFQFLIELMKYLCNSSVEDDVRVGYRRRGAKHTEFKLISGKCKR